MSSHVFQTTFPADEAAKIARAVLSSSFTWELVREAWVVAEYGIAQISPQSEPAMARAAGPEAEEQAMQALLVAAESKSHAQATFLPIPWGIVISVLLKLIQAAV